MSLSIRKTLGTGSGWFCVWDHQSFLHVVDYDMWEEEVNLNDTCEEHIVDGHLIPISTNSDGVWDFEVRVGKKGELSSLTDREKPLLRVSSEPYFFRSTGKLNISGAEFVGAEFDTNQVGSLDINQGNYEVTIHMINWKKEAGDFNNDGKMSPNALPDFVVLLTQVDSPSNTYRTDLSTFDVDIGSEDDE